MDTEQDLTPLVPQPGAGPAAAPGAPWPPDDELLPHTADRRARLRRFLPRSLTARLVTGVVALVIVVVLAVGAGTYFALRSFLYNRLDQQLDSTASGSIVDLFESGRTTQTSGLRAPQRVWAVALYATSQGADDYGEVRPYAAAVETMQLSRADCEALIRRASTDPLTIRTNDGHRLRVTVRPIPITVGPSLVVGRAVIGLSTDEVQRTLGWLITLELIIGAAAIIVAFGATTWGVRFNLRRLHAVTDTAQEVAAELSPEGTGLDRRVEVDEDGTEVGRLAESMNTLLAAVETQFAARLESEQRMRQFLADASHELRTPLTSIRGYAELARMRRALGSADETGADGDGDAGDTLARIEAEGTRMSRLVEDLLTLARGDQGGPPVMAPVDVDDLLADVVAGSRAAFPERDIRDSPPSGLGVVGDQDQLLRAVRNLVSNAATHTRPDGVIALRAFASGPGVAIQVLDQGPGLPPEEAAHVFERFWRADRARTRARGGSGLGLAIVASIVAQHGGTVHFESTVEHGSTVTIWLPARTDFA